MPLSLIIFLPFLGFLVNGLFGAKLKKPLPGIIASLAVLASFGVAVINFLNLVQQDLTQQPENARRIAETVYTWMNVGSFKVDVGFLLDPLSGVMILVVTGIGFLIHLYSIGYMADDHNDPESKLYARYFTFLNLFIAFMALLILADNYLLMFVGWEGVGLCSYFLIGFWFKREDASKASKKAFVVNRIGDMGFLLGMTLIFLTTGTLKYFAAGKGVLDRGGTDLNVFSTGIASNYAQMFGVSGVVLITILLFIGCCGKSAQLPLYTWLPDAMAGPTPVSALIHAATMVTAGVYICARSSALFDMAPQTKLIIAVVGALTAVVAGLTALAHNDIKKVLAYSTVSQLGIMFVGVGAGAYSAAIFHVLTHAFFKACLFLGAGSVIHALHGEQDMRKMGGLKAKMKLTNITFLLSGLALAGAVPFSGFFSKDEIIGEAFNAGGVHQIIAFAMLGVAFITAMYTGRQYAQVFGGTARDEHLIEHAHESSGVMTLPLVVLAIGAVFAGFLSLPHLDGLPPLHALADWLVPVFAHSSTGNAVPVVEHAPDKVMLAAGAVIGWLGWVLGIGMGKNAGRAMLPETTDKVSLDAVYGQVFGRGGFRLTQAARWIDDKVIDGFVNGIGSGVRAISGALRQTQTSFVRNYALGMALGAIVLIALFAVNR